MISSSNKNSTGFTLIEVLITVTIVAILAAIALPSYSEYIAKSRRAEATTVVLEASQFMRRYYSANDSFPTSLPNGTITVPQGQTGAGVLYSVNVASDTTTYTVTAAIQSSGSYSSDKCGSFVLNARGQKLNIYGGGSPTTIAGCWK
jgi:type IV pilus assembly protein PilE